MSGYSTFHFLPLLVGLYASFVGRRRGAAALAALLDQLHARGIGERATLGPGHMLLILPFGAHGVFVPRREGTGGSAEKSASAEKGDGGERGGGGQQGGGGEQGGSGQISQGPPLLNPSLDPFDLSVIRAAELFVRPVCDVYEAQLMGSTGNSEHAAGAAGTSNTAAGSAAGNAAGNAGGNAAGNATAWHQVLELTAEEKAKEEEAVRRFTQRQEALCSELGLSRQDWLYLATRMQLGWDVQGASRGDDDADDE